METTMSRPLQVDRAQIACFIQTLYKHAPRGGYVALTAFYDKGDDGDRNEVPCRPVWLPCDDLDRVIERACKRAERGALGEIGHRLGRKVLADVATIAQPDTLLGWYRKLVARKFDGSKARRGPGNRASSERSSS
jgi:hypothetical protein